MTAQHNSPIPVAALAALLFVAEPSAAQAQDATSATGLSCQTVERRRRPELDCNRTPSLAEELAVRIQIGLQVFGCNVARLDADLSANEPAVACLRAKFGREDTGPLTDEERAALSIAGTWPDETSALRAIELSELTLEPRPQTLATGWADDLPSVYYLDPIPVPARNATCIHHGQQPPRCVDAAGAEIRIRPLDLQDMFVEFGLRYLGCHPIRLDGDLSNEQAAINCFHELFGTRKGSLDIAQKAALAGAGRKTTADAAFKYLQSKRYTPVGFAWPSDPPAPEIMAQVTHPDGDKFTFPREQLGYETGKIDVFARLQEGRAVVYERMLVRWANPADFAGRTFSIMQGDRALLLLHFRQNSAVATDSNGATRESLYTTRGTFTCVPDPAGWRRACVGIALSKPEGDWMDWTLTAAFSNLRGLGQPLPFGELYEGRDAWDEAIARDEAARTALAARVAAGEELEALPLHDLPPADAYLIGATYDAPFMEHAEWPSIRFAPYIAYHTTYASVCANDFDGPSINWVDARTGLREVYNTGLARTEVWETYIAREIPIQREYHERFGAAINRMARGAATDPRSAAGPQLMADFLNMFERRIAGMSASFAKILNRVGCSGPTIDRLERNLAASFDKVAADY